MKRLAALAIALVVSRPAVGQVPTPLPASLTTPTVNRVQAVIDKSVTTAGDFTEEHTDKATNQKTSMAGHLVFAKPDTIDLAYTTPNGNRLTGNGTTLSIYDAALRRTVTVPLTTSTTATALTVLVSRGALASSFTFEAFDGSRFFFPEGTLLIAQPKAPMPALAKLLIYAETKTGFVRRVIAIDPAGNRTRIDLNEVTSTP